MIAPATLNVLKRQGWQEYLSVMAVGVKIKEAYT